MYYTVPNSKSNRVAEGDATIVRSQNVLAETKMGQDAAVCPVCGIAVGLENCKIDEGGRAVHEACYLASLEKRRSESSVKKPPSESKS
jgi:hypothetical protein